MKNLSILLFLVALAAGTQAQTITYTSKQIDSLEYSHTFYKVQLCSSTYIDASKFSGFQDHQCEIEEVALNGKIYYRYLVNPLKPGDQAAEDLLLEAQTIYPDAFVVFYSKNKRRN